MSKPVPRWVLRNMGMTARQWRAEKRAAAKAALVVLEEGRPGIAFLPPQAYENYREAVRAVEALRKSLSVKELGR